MKTEELQKELEQAELEKIRAIDKVKEIKARIAEAEKEPSIYELMPIGSVWCGWEVVNYDTKDIHNPIELIHLFSRARWPLVKDLHKLIAEQKKLDAMKRAADAAAYFSANNPNALAWLQSEVEDYRKIIEKEGE